jgi:hypothetical protein
MGVGSMGLSKDDILSALPKLSKADLSKIKTTCEGLLDQDLDPVLKEFSRDLYFVCCLNFTQPRSYDLFKHTDGYKAWKKNLPSVQAWVHKSLARGGKRRQFLILACSLLAKDLERRKIPLTLGALAVNIGRLGEVFEAGFPGYIKSGLLPMLLTAMGKREK